MKLDRLSMHAIRDGKKVTVFKAEASGYVWDIYDWRFMVHRHPAVLQVGYEPACGRKKAGKIFGHYTYFNTKAIALKYIIKLK